MVAVEEIRSRPLVAERHAAMVQLVAERMAVGDFYGPNGALANELKLVALSDTFARFPMGRAYARAAVTFTRGSEEAWEEWSKNKRNLKWLLRSRWAARKALVFLRRMTKHSGGVNKLSHEELQLCVSVTRLLRRKRQTAFYLNLSRNRNPK